MDSENKNPTRRKFIVLGLASAAVMAAVKFFKPSPPPAQTVKMLTQEGKLVEVDIAALPGKKKKITNAELQNWIKNKKTD